MRYLIIAALMMQCDGTPRVVELAKSYRGSATVVPTYYCEDDRRVMLMRQNGEHVCVDFDLIETHMNILWNGQPTYTPTPAYTPVSPGTITISPTVNP